MRIARREINSGVWLLLVAGIFVLPLVLFGIALTHLWRSTGQAELPVSSTAAYSALGAPNSTRPHAPFSSRQNEAALAAIGLLPSSHPFANCSVCHGAEAQGNEQTMAPRLAGMDPVYLKKQLEAFKQGWRGQHPEDRPGQLMAAALQTLDEKSLGAAVAHTQKIAAERPDLLFGDRWLGEQLYKRNCAVCHGEQAEGVAEYHIPRLDQQHGWYLYRQLNAYREGLRGTHHEDQAGRSMAFYAKLLPDEESVKAVVAFLTRVGRGKRIQSRTDQSVSELNRQASW